MQKNKKIISIIIPVYNEENYILQTVQKVITSNALGFEKEIIIVDDCSTDKTVSLVKKFIAKTTHNIQLIEKKKNEGKGGALKLGFLKSSGDIVLIQDADLEYNPNEYPTLIAPFITHNADVVYGSRFISDKTHRILYFWHSVGNKMLTTFSNMLTNLNLTDMETGYKVFRGEIIRSIVPHLKAQRFGFEPEITARIAKIKGIAIYEVGISYQGRTYDEGKKIGWKDGVRAILEIIIYNLFSSS